MHVLQYHVHLWHAYVYPVATQKDVADLCLQCMCKCMCISVLRFSRYVLAT